MYDKPDIYDKQYAVLFRLLEEEGVNDLFELSYTQDNAWKLISQPIPSRKADQLSNDLAEKLLPFDTDNAGAISLEADNTQRTKKIIIDLSELHNLDLGFISNSNRSI